MVRAVEECLGRTSDRWRQQVTLTPTARTESIFHRSFSVSDLAVLSGGDKREGGSQDLGVIDIQ